jgi:RimJ/RimL family protein N-acetyltransferase
VESIACMSGTCPRCSNSPPILRSQRARVCRTRTRRLAGTAHVFAIEDEGRFVGLVGFHQIEAGAAELGYWVGHADQGRGIGGHAVRAAVRVAFDYLRLRRLWADVLADNLPSIRILERLGFRCVGERTHDVARWPQGVLLRRFELVAPVAWSA